MFQKWQNFWCWAGWAPSKRQPHHPSFPLLQRCKLLRRNMSRVLMLLLGWDMLTMLRPQKSSTVQPIRQADTVGNNSLLLLEVWKNKKCLLLQKGWIVKLSRKVLFSLSKKTYFSVSLFPCRNYKYLGGSVYALILKPRTGSSGIWSSLSWNKVYLHVFAKFESCVYVSSTSTSMCTQLQRNQWVGVQPLFAITNHVQNVAKAWVSLPGQLGFTHDVTAATAFQIWKISPRNQWLSKVTLNPLIHWWNHPRSLPPPIQRSMHTAVLRTPTHAVLLADLQEFGDSNAGGVATCTTTPETKPPSCVNLNSTIEKHNQKAKGVPYWEEVKDPLDRGDPE